MKETAIQSSILQYLKVKGIFNFRVNNGGIFREGRWTPSSTQTKGVPDIIVVKAGQFIGIEVKSEKGRLSPFQIAFKQRLEAQQGVYLVARSVRDVQTYFEA